MKLFQKYFNHSIIDKFDPKNIHIMRNGIKFSLLFCLFAVLILSIYCTIGNPLAFYVGISLLKSGCFYIVSFIICGFAFNKICKDVM